MRIISKFKDYYDCAQQAGTDTTRVFMRESRDVGMRQHADLAAPWLQLPQLELVGGWSTAVKESLRLERIFVLFAGKLYRGLTVRHPPLSLHFSRDERGTQNSASSGDAEGLTFYDANAAIVYIEQQLPRQERRDDKPFSRSALAQQLREILSTQGTGEFLNWSVEHRVATAVMRVSAARWSNPARHLTLNPPLASVQFYRLFDPWAAFQELDMFWGGVLAPESRPMPQVEDKYRIAQHGFDDRSFRKVPTKKRTR